LKIYAGADKLALLTGDDHAYQKLFTLISALFRQPFEGPVHGWRD
jgi:hypothetical protein